MDAREQIVHELLGKIVHVIELTFDGVHFTEQGHHAFAAQMKKSASNDVLS